jgi:gas vesicle protein
MSENHGGSGEALLALILGAVVGAAAGLLLAPHAGKDTRRRLRKWMEDVGEEIDDAIRGSSHDRGR